MAKDILLGVPLAENLWYVAEEVVFSESILQGLLLISDNEIWWRETQIILPELR